MRPGEFNQRTKSAVEEALRTDSSLKEEVERIRKKLRKARFEERKTKEDVTVTEQLD
ncbi:hypothetical protein N657DRAFT_683544 [Parathielavia appendiculata]|uniref:Uncharacterized protein n=1 Tax=Parathielavia appendiculata TaxID=2587402 RepID=A0AAN6TUW9_9PEZI|nr:hypothetical protein N657DRAFT_683544 [Parathielavia appendiculata]